MGSSPMGQTILIGVIFFLVFASYYTIQGYASVLFGPALASNALSTLYAVFTAACFVAPGIVNRYGPKRALMAGIFGYCAFSASAFVYSLCPWASGLVILGGCLNGFGAAVLWTAQGRLLLDVAASDETRDVGAHFAVFWALFNGSAILGGIGTFVYLSKSKGDAALFAAFTVLIALGGCATLLLRDTKSTTEPQEVRATLSLFFTKRAALLAPIFWYSGFNQPYQLDGFGDRFFRERYLGLELAIFYAASVVGGYAAAQTLDAKGRSRRASACRGLFIFFITSAPPYALAAYLETTRVEPTGFGRPIAQWLPSTLVFVFWGFSDSYIQAYAYWLIDALYDNTGSERARAVGLYKFVQSAGWCLGFAILPRKRCPYLVQLAASAACFVVGTALALLELPSDAAKPADPESTLTTNLLVQQAAAPDAEVAITASK